MTATEPSAENSLANRYGGKKRALSGRTKLIIALAAVAVAVILLGAVVVRNATNSVSFKDVGFNVVDPTLTEVDFQVTKEPGSTAECAVKAMNEGFAVVGWKVVTIGPNDAATGSDGGRTTAHREAVRTESVAVSGMIDRCWIVDAGS